MANRRIPTSTKAEVIALDRQGVSHREIAERLGLSRGTIKRMIEASAPTPETAARETPGAVMDIPPELLALGVPIRTARDLLAATDAKRKMLRLAEESGRVMDMVVVQEILATISEWHIDAYGPKYWRLLESQGLDYETVRRYAIDQEKALTTAVNAFVTRVGIQPVEDKLNV